MSGDNFFKAAKSQKNSPLRLATW